jgi:hypothetical protein
LRFRELAKKFSPPQIQEDAMNRKRAALAFVLAASCSGLASADGVQSDSDVRATLAQQGYSAIGNVRRDGDSWEVDAKAASGTVKLRVDSATGVVHPDENSSEMSPMDILQSMQAAGYTNIGSVRFFGGVWKATATSSAGKYVEVRVDPSDGHIIDETER